ncbi:hypothetical protein [Corynebacterium uterequi]|uniref:Extracellular solute-binding protein n=1 Tax=Corynebacterium uterequi TaxID=1072256 RepID=A0A0G3HCI2_9CORY|nr:hypothetical protein [Corynebacterium uterequi]AKK11019.1 hypothetical protein CUTER_05090 [Corynebacterium uterequi]
MNSQQREGRGSCVSILIGVILIAVAVAAIVFGTGQRFLPFSKHSSPLGDDDVVQGIIGSEKAPFFDDPRVVDALADEGLRVEFTTAGSRSMAEKDLANYDFAFPSSSPTADRISEAMPDNLGSVTPFYSPMAVATFEPILQALQGAGAARREGEHWYIDVAAFMELNAARTRWRDVAPDYPNPRIVQIASTDVRSSNSAAMYLAIVSWVANGGAVPGSGEVLATVDRVRPLFVEQGYTERSSAGPFGDYLSQGIGSKPMVMVYEAQFLGEAMSKDSRIREDMVLAYPDPTVHSNHTLVALTESGRRLADVLNDDPELQQLAAEHGFRPHDPALFAEVLGKKGVEPPPEFLPAVDPPAFATLEKLIEGVGMHYATAAPPEEGEQQ